MNGVEKDLKKMISQKYGSLKNFSDVVNIPYPTLDSIFKRGLKRSQSVNLVKICAALNINVSKIILREEIVEEKVESKEDLEEDNTLIDPKNLIDVFTDMASRGTLLCGGGVTQKDLLIQIIGTIVKVSMEKGAKTKSLQM